MPDPGKSEPQLIEGYRPYHAKDCPARTALNVEGCTCGGLEMPLFDAPPPSLE